MISTYYHRSSFRRSKISLRRGTYKQFVIPEHHLAICDEDIASIKCECLKFQMDFRFIKEQIKIEQALKKQKDTHQTIIVGRQKNKQMNKQMDRQIGEQTNGQTGEQTNEQAKVQVQTNRRMSKQMYRPTHTCPEPFGKDEYTREGIIHARQSDQHSMALTFRVKRNNNPMAQPMGRRIALL